MSNIEWTERKYYTSNCMRYEIIQYVDYNDDFSWSRWMPEFEGSCAGFSLDTLEGAKEQCERHRLGRGVIREGAE